MWLRQRVPIASGSTAGRSLIVRVGGPGQPRCSGGGCRLRALSPVGSGQSRWTGTGTLVQCLGYPDPRG